MNKKQLAGSIALAISAIATSSVATAATAVINLSGGVTNWNFAPEVTAEQQAGILEFAGALVGYDTQIVVYNYGNSTGGRGQPTVYDYGVGSYDFSSTETLGLMVQPTFAADTQTGLLAFENNRRGVNVANPDFNPSLPTCSGRDISRAAEGDECFGAVENTELLRTDATANFGQLVGEASMTFGENGLMESFDYLIGGETMIDYTEGEALDDFLFGYYLTQVTLGLENFVLNGQDGDILYFTADANLTADIGSPVPVPAAAWLFGSALLGMAGIKRRK